MPCIEEQRRNAERNPVTFEPKGYGRARVSLLSDSLEASRKRGILVGIDLRIYNKGFM